MKNKIPFLKTGTIGSLIFLLFVLFFSSCIPKPIDIDIKPPTPKLVIASQIIPNSIMLVSVTRSFSALNSSAQSNNVSQNLLDTVLVSNAFVTVTHGTIIDTLFMLSPGIYGSINVLQQTGGTYELYVHDTQRNLEAQASSILLPRVLFDTVTPFVTRSPQDTTVAIEYTFTDDPSTANYYLVNYIVKLHSGDPLSIDLNSYFPNQQNKVLSDFDLISDQTFTGTYTKRTDLFTATGTDTIAVTLSNISKGYFEFLTAFKRANGVINTLTGEPITYPTNILGGFGYFNTHYPDVKYYDLNLF